MGSKLRLKNSFCRRNDEKGGKKPNETQIYGLNEFIFDCLLARGDDDRLIYIFKLGRTRILSNKHVLGLLFFDSL